MKQIRQRRILIVFLLIVTGAGVSCGTDGPGDGYRKLYEAVKSKNTAAIKARMTKKTHDFAEMASKRNNTPIEKVFENGFTATTFAEDLPEIRDERVKVNMGAVEVWNANDRRWEDLPFIKEDGEWKLAVGDLFMGSYKSPGKGRSTREAEAANVVSNRGMPPNPPADANTSEQGNAGAKTDAK